MVKTNLFRGRRELGKRMKSLLGGSLEP
jgi:hypothetical protein